MHFNYIDYSRAFDTNNRAILIRKLRTSAISHRFMKWICNFLSVRTQVVNSVRRLSSRLPIMQSVVKGSGIRSLLYIILASDLKLLSQINQLCKFAYDAILISPQTG